MPSTIITYLIGYTTLLIILLSLSFFIYQHYHYLQADIAFTGYKAIAESIAGQIRVALNQRYNATMTLKYPLIGPGGIPYEILIGYGYKLKQIYPVLTRESISNDSLYVVVRSVDGKYYKYHLITTSSNVFLGRPNNEQEYYSYSSETMLQIGVTVINNRVYIDIIYRGLRK